MNNTYTNHKIIVSDRGLQEALAGLRKSNKEIRSKWLYDERGSQLFDQIVELEEYYPPTVEMQILKKNLAEMVDLIPQDSVLLELGSGSSIKTRLLLDAGRADLYVPIDISNEHLMKTAAQLEERYPDLKVHPIHGEYFDTFTLPDEAADLPLTVFFPGTSLGNLFPDEQLHLLQNIAGMISCDGGFLIGVDMKKDPEVLHLAYNDPQGITAEFNLNILRHLNERFGANFELENFVHYAPYNPVDGRMEMHLISQTDQQVSVSNEKIHIKRGETILTEVSYKFTTDQFCDLANRAGMRIEGHWTDENEWFSMFYLVKK